MSLPPFPVDDQTLDMLLAAIDPRSAGDEQAERSCVGEFLTMMAQLGGSDTEAVEEWISDDTVVMRDPAYHEHCVMRALVEEIRRLRRDAPEVWIVCTDYADDEIFGVARSKDQAKQIRERLDNGVDLPLHVVCYSLPYPAEEVSDA
jgi:hypothetical protein